MDLLKSHEKTIDRYVNTCRMLLIYSVCDVHLTICLCKNASPHDATHENYSQIDINFIYLYYLMMKFA